MDALKGVKIRKFPKVLIFSLNRFLFDYEILDRIKVNQNFAFSLEFNTEKFQEIPNIDPSENEYELMAVIIHRGTAYQGHYHAYIRDVANEGNWETLMKSFEDKKEEIKKKALAEAYIQKQSKKIEENLNKMELESKHKSEETGTEPEKNEPEPPQNEKKKNQKKKGEKKPKKEGGKGSKKEKDEKKKTDEKKNEDEQYLRDEFFDELEFPIPFKNQNLAKNWYDFNDSTVTAIPLNRLQKQYGGSNENAYLLIYRQVKLGHSEEPFVIPDYLTKVINVQNEVFQKERMAYKDAEKHIEIFIISSKDINVKNTIIFPKINL